MGLWLVYDRVRVLICCNADLEARQQEKSVNGQDGHVYILAVLFLIGAVIVVIWCAKWTERGRVREGRTGIEPKIEVTDTLQGVSSDLDMKFQYIRSGSFMMGSPAFEGFRGNDEDQYNVTLPHDFYMATTELTQGQWQKLMGSTPWLDKSEVRNGSDKVAATYVSWDDAREFCVALNKRHPNGNWEFRLPMEAEWEYCCRAGSSTAYSFGTSAEHLGDFGWFVDNAGSVGERYAHLVQQKQGNKWGLFDMHGNVWEWCQDGLGERESESPTDPTTPRTILFPVMRGGSWSNFALDCRSANRSGGMPGSRFSNLGFRLVLAPK